MKKIKIFDRGNYSSNDRFEIEVNTFLQIHDCSVNVSTNSGDMVIVLVYMDE
jgi:hypothetical protein